MGEVIRVACAIIEDDGRILAARRSENMSMPLKWEFPGGKVEKGERPEDTIVREIKEELDMEIEVVGSLPSRFHNYVSKSIELIPYICRITGGNIKLNEHKEIKWGRAEELAGLDWAAADLGVYKDYIKYLKQR